jgi:alpha-L-fucosidase 2
MYIITLPVTNRTSILYVTMCILIFASCFEISGANRYKKSNQPEVIKSAFDPETASWDIAWPGKVSQYDLVYLSPPMDPMQGIPLGNGDLGVLIWCEDSRIIAVVNKSDLWDDAPFGSFHNWDPKEEDYSTTQRHACRIVIDLKFPVFSTLYLSQFKAKLNLADASLTLETESPFGKLSFNAFVDHGSGVLFYDLLTDFKEDVPVDISLERYGSRTYSHWYSQINRDASVGLSGTESLADCEGSFITQKLSSGTFAIGGTVIRNNSLTINYTREHSRCADIQLSGNPLKMAHLAFCVTSPGMDDPLRETRNMLSWVRQKGLESFQKSQEDAWKAIWNHSFMDYGDDYLSNLWYLTLYYANASQGGKYPGRFNNGLWGWDRDVQNWNFYFHWNQQQLCWPLNAAGFHELVNPYLDFRFRSLPQARKDAKDFFNSGGAFISDVTDRRGYNSAMERDNHTPVAEIALDFWRQYQYTGDKEFLKEKAVPFILDAAKFYESLFEKEDDGLYHAREGTGYEGWIKLKDGLTELVYAQALFSTALDALQEAEVKIPETKKWKEILDHLAPLPIIKADDNSEIMAAGWGIKENKWLTTYYPDTTGSPNKMKLLDGIFPSVPSSPVFPSGVIGLKQSGTRLFDCMTATALLYSPEVTGWDPVPIVLARLGLANELAKDLERFPGRWQIYCNGWGHWGVEGEVNKDAEWFFRTNKVRDVNADGKSEFPLPMWPFRHMSMESMSVLATAMNESLLQSYDGVLRIAPAFAKFKSGRFTLHAEGGFIISSEIETGRVKWISIRSLRGNPCRVKLPWEKAIIKSNRKKRTISGNEFTEIKTEAGEILTITPETMGTGSWIHIQEAPRGNENVKYHPSGKAKLGIPRMF